MAGRRRFTLFPPEQVANLYIGPLDHAPAGTPMSLVDFARPDFDRFPRFREALAHARVAELAPGDAIYMPPLWWHHVQSLERFNMLVNYWWMRRAPGHAAPPLGARRACCTRSPRCAACRRRSARPGAQLFEHYVFDAERDVTGHIPPERQGLLGPTGPAQNALLRGMLAKRLTG